MRSAFLGITTVVITIALIAGANIAGKWMKDKAIDGCLQAGRITFTNGNGQQANVPDNYWYNDCMAKKGYEVPKDK